MNQNEVANAFQPDFSRQHGCAWFVWPAGSAVHEPEKTGGWASIGGEPAFQFQRASDLPKNVLWWTNLSKSEAWSLGRWSHIKHAGFLGPDWISLMSEWGFPKEIDELKIACSSWAEVLARMAEWLNRWNSKMIASSSDEPNPDWSWGDGDFYEVLSDRLGWFVPKDQSHPALSVAYCDQVDQEIPAMHLSSKRKLFVSLPRTQHARFLWNTRYPSGSFKEITPTQWPSSPSDRWAWIAQQQNPILIRFDEVRWRTGFEREAQLWWGLRGRRFAAAAMDPVWMTGEEALEMQPLIDADPAACLQASGWTSIPSIDRWPLDDRGVLFDNSLVTGLLCEGLWRAAATPIRTPTKRIKSGVSPRAVWWRAADRRRCYQMAKIFQEKGFDVLSYGQGGVCVLFDPDTVLMQDWVDALEKSGARAPLSLALHLSMDGSFNDVSVDRWLKKTGTMENWLFLDRLLWPWMGREKSALKPILEHAMRSLGGLTPPASSAPNAITPDEWARQWKNELRLRAKQAVQEIAG